MEVLFEGYTKEQIAEDQFCCVGALVPFLD